MKLILGPFFLFFKIHVSFTLVHALCLCVSGTLFRLQAKGKLTEGLTKKGTKGDGGDTAAQGVNAPECDDDSDSVEDSDDDEEEKVDAHTLFE